MFLRSKVDLMRRFGSGRSVGIFPQKKTFIKLFFFFKQNNYMKASFESLELQVFREPGSFTILTSAVQPCTIIWPKISQNVLKTLLIIKSFTGQLSHPEHLWPHFVCVSACVRRNWCAFVHERVVEVCGTEKCVRSLCSSQGCQQLMWVPALSGNFQLAYLQLLSPLWVLHSVLAKKKLYWTLDKKMGTENQILCQLLP